MPQILRATIINMSQFKVFQDNRDSWMEGIKNFSFQPTNILKPL